MSILLKYKWTTIGVSLLVGASLGYYIFKTTNKPLKKSKRTKEEFDGKGLQETENASELNHSVDKEISPQHNIDRIVKCLLTKDRCDKCKNNVN